jgi:hypothetical protein
VNSLLVIPLLLNVASPVHKISVELLVSKKASCKTLHVQCDQFVEEPGQFASERGTD